MSGIDLLMQRADDVVETGPTPRYIRLANIIRELIQDGKLRPEEAIPSERSLVDATRLSRVTVRRAIALLVEEGLIEQRHGSGTFVSTQPGRIEQPLTTLTGFHDDMMFRGRRPSSRWLEKREDTPGIDEAMTLGLSPNAPVLRFHRLRLADGEPLAIEYAVVPADLMPGVNAVKGSLYAAMAEHGCLPTRALQRMQACAMPEVEAQHLGMEPGAPALRIERVSRIASGRAVELTRSYYRGDRYEFVAELSIGSVEVDR